MRITTTVKFREGPIARSAFRMSLAIATASQVRVLCYNYHDLQWGEEKTCRVRVIEESGEYILRIDSKDGGVSPSMHG